MALDKAIEHGKERRKPYYKSKAVDATCRPGGSCPYCQRGRQHKHRKRLAEAQDRMNDDPTAGREGQNTQDQQPRTKEAANMSDENERSAASAGSVAELVETIAAFMDQTDRFKGGAVPVVTPEATRARVAFFRLRKLLGAAPPQHALTDAEQEAIQEVIDYLQPAGQRYPNHVAATLRGLLERLG